MSPFSPNTGSSNPAYVSGDVELFDALGPQTTNIVQAHKSAVSCISMNSEGTLLATASEKVSFQTSCIQIQISNNLLLIGNRHSYLFNFGCHQSISV